jgi:hypothetical protein
MACAILEPAMAGTWRRAATALFAAAVMLAPPIVRADDGIDSLARDLIDRFYDALAPDNHALGEFLGDGFQIIGSDGLRFDRETYLSFPKTVTSYEISDLVARRQGNVLTTTFEVGYTGRFEGAARTVPNLARMAVFGEFDGDWQLLAFAALGTGENDVTVKAAEVVAAWRAAIASGDRARIHELASPDFQHQRPDDRSASFAELAVEAHSAASIEGLIATSFSNTMVTRYKLRRDGKRIPHMTVFQRINGQWRAAAEAEYLPIE